MHHLHYLAAVRVRSR